MASRKKSDDKTKSPVEELQELVDEKEFEDEEKDAEDGEDEDEEGEDSEEVVEEDDEDEDDLLAAADAEDEEEEYNFFEEEAGYDEEYDWANLEPEEKTKHEEYLEMSADALAKLNYSRVSIFHRWAVAQAFAKHGMRDKFQDACLSIVKSRRKHEALLYEDIYLCLVSDLAEAKEFDRAEEMLDKFEKAYPDEEAIVQRVRGLLEIEKGNIHDGKRILDGLMSKADDSGELHLEIGDDLVAMGHADLALNILDRGKDFAQRARDIELMTAIDETRRLALEMVET